MANTPSYTDKDLNRFSKKASFTKAPKGKAPMGPHGIPSDATWTQAGKIWKWSSTSWGTSGSVSQERYATIKNIKGAFSP